MTERGIRAAILANGPTDLYRLYDGAGNLLYVGISGKAARRLLEHAEVKPWWPEVRHVAFERLPTRQEAVETEIDAIREERPKHNIAGRVEGPVPPLPEMVLDLTPLQPPEISALTTVELAGKGFRMGLSANMWIAFIAAGLMAVLGCAWYGFARMTPQQWGDPVAIEIYLTPGILGGAIWAAMIHSLGEMGAQAPARASQDPESGEEG